MENLEYQNMHAIETTHFWFVGKRKFLAIALDRYFGKKKGIKVLDVGCGSGAIMEFLNARGYETHGIDMSETAIAFCKERGLRAEYGMAGDIRFPDATFDMVCAFDVLEHIEDDREAVAEIARVLKPGGVFIATVPAHQFLFSYHDELLHHKRRYGKGEFISLLQSQFTLRFVSWIHSSILFPIIVSRIAKKILRVSSKTSDVKPVNNFVNAIGTVVYALELAWFRIFKKMPFGLSLMAIAQKK